MNKNKLEKLKNILKGMESAVVAYSGGVDSSFLLKVAVSVLGKENVLAVTADSETYPASQKKEAESFAKKLKVPHRIIHTKELDIKNFKDNPVNRCYFCKKELFQTLRAVADKKKLKNVIDGSNLDDKDDWRPGSIALKELGIRSPLDEAGLRKNDIRLLSREFKLPTWDKPSFACLASRFPYNQKITKKKLKRVEAAEEFLKGLGFRQVRVRSHEKLARIEIETKELKKAIQVKDKIIKRFKSLGFTYITLDLAGYRTGSMNETLNA